MTLSIARRSSTTTTPAPTVAGSNLPTGSPTLDNPLCGDEVRLELCLGSDGRIEQVRFDGHGCVISQAATSLLADRVEGAASRK